jgi:antitoxin (DNA-binding transcriptional repressor) of toxin-antitoxin stability system
VGEPGFVARAEDQPAWAEIVRKAEPGEPVAVIAHGGHVADVVPSGELCCRSFRVSVAASSLVSVGDMRRPRAG